MSKSRSLQNRRIIAIIQLNVAKSSRGSLIFHFLFFVNGWLTPLILRRGSQLPVIVGHFPTQVRR